MLCIHAYHSFSPVSLSALTCNAPHNVYTTQHMSSFYHHDKLFAGASLLIETSPLHHKDRNTPMSSASNYESSRSQANIAAGDAAGVAAGGLIPSCVLRDTSKMRKVGHRTEAFRIGFQLIEPVTYLVNDLIKRGKSEIRQVFFTHFFPYMFHRIELWTVGRLSNESNICWNLEIF